MLKAESRISKKEMERRHTLLREKIKEADLNLLLVSGVRFVAGKGYLRYLTNWAEPFGGETLLFPLEEGSRSARYTPRSSGMWTKGLISWGVVTGCALHTCSGPS